MKSILLTILFLLHLAVALAVRVPVANASQINGTVWNAGDTLEMKNGTWTNQKIIFKGSGLADKPVVLIAQTPGQVILNGTSCILMSGSYLVVSGLYFKNGTLSGNEVVSFRTSSTELADHCRLTNTAIINYNPADPTVDSKWVSLFGTFNQVDHCSFENKTNMGTLLVVWLTMGTIPKHVISQNYFGYRNANVDSTGSQLNGQEIIRLGDSSTSMQVANVTVEGNFFEKCNGETEIISNKSCENVLTNNLFLECQGTLTLRHGNGTLVEGNWFFGNGVQSTGGVRIIGENHRVFNNYFERLRGTGFRAALSVVRGKLNSAANEYFQVKNATVAFNTMVDCDQAFCINYNSSSTYTMPPVTSVIAYNHVYNSGANAVNIDISQTDPAMDITWRNNLMNQGSYINFSPATAQVVKGLNPQMKSATTPIAMQEPTSAALAGYATSEISDVTKDIRGRERSSAKIPGASQLSGAALREMPSKLTVGATFYKTTDVPSRLLAPLCTIVAQAKSINASVRTSGVLSVFDVEGHLMLKCRLHEGENRIPFVSSGLFIVRFEAADGRMFCSKIHAN